MKKLILRMLAVALVLVLPWTVAAAVEVSAWSEIVSAYNGWQSAEFTLMADVAADSVIDVPSWRGMIITLNDYRITPPEGQASAFGGDRAATYVVDDAEEFAFAAADPGSSTIRMADSINLTSDIVLVNNQKIDTASHSLTKTPGVKIIAEVSSYDALKSAMENNFVTSVKLTADIQINENYTIQDISKLDLNGHSVTRGADWATVTVGVGSEEALKTALNMEAVTKIQLTDDIQLTGEVEIDYAALSAVDKQGFDFSAVGNGGFVAGVTTSADMEACYELDYVKSVKLLNDITFEGQIGFDSTNEMNAWLDKNGYKLTYAANSGIGLNVSDAMGLYWALNYPQADYYVLTKDINLNFPVTINSANMPQFFAKGHKVTGAGITCNAGSWELLKTACELGLPGVQITLTRDIDAKGTLNIGADTTIDLQFHNIKTTEDTLFNVLSGKLTIKDVQPLNHNRVDRIATEDSDSNPFCKQAYFSTGWWNARYFNYYVTKSEIVDSQRYRNAATKETRYNYQVNVAEVGIIDASESTNPIFKVAADGELDIQGGIYYGSKDRAIYSYGDVTLSGDTVFANNGGYNGGAVFMADGKMTIKPHIKNTHWHGVVFTGNCAWEGSSGGAIYIDIPAELVMEEGYVTNNWCQEAEGDAGWSGGGGIAVAGVMNMKGGWVTANQAIGGGGIKTMINGWEEGGDFIMTGGTVAGNLATKFEGGGIVINHSSYGKITGGYITNNETKSEQHWGGGGVFISDYGYLEMEAVLILHNDAGGYGGGLAGCSTGRIDTHDTTKNFSHGTAIFENAAEGKNLSGTDSSKDVDRIYAANDEAFLRDNGAHYQDYFCALSSYICGGMLGDNAADWSGTADGRIINQGTVKKTDAITGMSITGLTSHPTQRAKDQALRGAKVFVSGNTAYTHGGGILCNGYLVVGAGQNKASIGDRMSIAGTKAADGFNLADYTGENAFTFRLVEDANNNGKADKQEIENYAYVVGTNDGNGNVTFNQRLTFNEEGTYRFLVYEEQNKSGFTYDPAVYRIRVEVECQEITVLDAQGDGNKHDTLAEPKNVDFNRIIGVWVAKGDADGSFAEEQKAWPLDGSESSANSSLDLGGLFSFTNSKGGQTTSVTVKKVWVDSDNNDGKRPENVTVQLYADGVAVEGKTATLTGKGNEWTHTFDNLPMYAEGAQGQKIVYTVKETSEVKGYTTAYSGDTLTITNTHEPEKVSVSVEKVWNDSNNLAGKRAKEITVQLTANGVAVEGKTLTLNAANGWKGEWTELDKYAAGNEITYGILEVKVPEGYAASKDMVKTGDNYAFTLTNSYGVETTSITVKKVWVDGDDYDGLRPENVTVQLLADGVAVAGKTATLTGTGNEWTYTFENLPKYAEGAQGKEIVYTVKETGEVKGYTTAYSGDTLTITNTHELEKVFVSVEKVWNDNNNLAGKRPDEITVQLTANSVAVEGKTLTLNAANGWKGEWTELDKYAAGTEITYGILEVKVPEGYAASKDMVKTGDNYAFTLTNSYGVETTSITVKKVWVDGDNNDGLRPENVTVQLLADGIAVEGKTATLTGTGNEWTYTFDNLPMYVEGAQGQKIVYTVEEIGTVKGYTTAYSGDTLTITNTHELEKVSVSVEKVWNDSNNLAGKRAKEITVQLTANGVAVEGKTLTLNAANGWKGEWTELDKYAAGTEITYGILEVKVPEGYEASKDMVKTGDNYAFILTNSYGVETTSITVKKVWVDGDNNDGKRPENVTVQLYADGDAVENKTATLTGTGNEWTYTFDNLPKYAEGAQGKEIEYTVEEIGEVKGYTTAYSGDTLTITNTHELEKVSVSVEKVWNDSNNLAGKRPAEIIVQLTANGIAVEDKTLTLNAANGWKGEWTELDKYVAGVAIEYGILEVKVPEGYAASKDMVKTGDNYAFTLTNSYGVETTSITVKKVWVDGDDYDGLRPENVTVQLLADGVAVAGKTATLTGKGNEWTHTFDNLPKYAKGAQGQKIVYTVEEIGTVKGYTTAYSGDTLTITNTHELEKVSVSVEKVWNDNNNLAGKRSPEITVQLTANSVAVEGKTLTLNAANGWKGEWTELDKYVAGVAIEYGILEVKVPEGYAASKDMVKIGDNYAFTLTNSYGVETTSITVKKVWVDGDDYDGLRPQNVTVQLYADGDAVENKTATLTGTGNEWTYTFDNLPKYAEGAQGKEIEYTVEEIGEVKGYTTAYSGDKLTITNTHELYKRYSLAVEKFDADDEDKLLKGAKFSVYSDKACTKLVGKIVTGTNGKGQLDDLLAGTYYLVETAAPAGYVLDKTVQEVKLGENDSKIVTVQMPNEAVIGALTLSKTVTGGVGSDWSFRFDIVLMGNGDDLAGSYDATRNGVATKINFAKSAEGAETSVTLKDGDTLTIMGLRDGVDYEITEESSDFYTTTVNGKQTNVAKGEISADSVSIAAFENKLQLTTFRVKKNWTGLEKGEKAPDISLTLYCNGKVYSDVTPVPNASGWYVYEGLPVMVNGVKAVYTVEEEPVEGFTTVYQNTGNNIAVTDCAYSGGTITNSKVPQTGDSEPLVLWVSMMTLAAAGLMGIMANRRKRV